MVYKPKEIEITTGFYVCTDGRIGRAEILVDNYLFHHERDKLIGILQKYGLKKDINWDDYRGDYDALRLFVRPEDIELMRVMLAEITTLSKKLESEHNEFIGGCQKICDEHQHHLNEVVAYVLKFDNPKTEDKED